MNIKDFELAWDGNFIVITTKSELFIGFAHADGRTLHIYKFDQMTHIENEYDTCSFLNFCLSNSKNSILRSLDTIEQHLSKIKAQKQLCICGESMLLDVSSTIASMKQQTAVNIQPLTATQAKAAAAKGKPLPAIPGIAAKSFTPGNVNRYPPGTVFHCIKSQEPSRWTVGKDYTVEFDKSFNRNFVEDNQGCAIEVLIDVDVQIAFIPGYGPNPYFKQKPSFVQQQGRAMRERVDGEFDVDVEEFVQEAKPTPKGYEPDEVRTDVDIMDLTRSIIGR